MFFYIKNINKPMPPLRDYPFVLLVRDSWDDYGYKTTFFSYYYSTEQSDPVEIGRVKIMKEGLEDGYTDIAEVFEELDESYCSLGQSVDYYKKIYTLGRPTYTRILNCMRDAATHPEILQRFNNYECFKNSLLRVSAAMKSLSEARFILHQAVNPDVEEEVKDFSFDFKCQLEGAINPHHIYFDFKNVNNFPSRMNVIIGRNGTGKTSYLANLAIALSGLGSKNEIVGNSAGVAFNRKEYFSNIVVVSYNPFDTFKLPGDFGGKGRNEDEGSLFGYKYCGIRDTFKAKSGIIYKIKTSKDMRRTITAALKRLNDKNKLTPIEDYIWPIFSDLSFNGKNFNSSVENFESLGSGQKLSLSILLDLAANINDESLVLIDEPENHLHPSLLSAFIHSLKNILDVTNSFAILATHSPVVLQEIPARYVRVLHRFGNKPKVDELDIESFGEEIGTITSSVFGYTNDMSDYLSVFKKFADNGLNLEQVEEIFGRRIGFSARSLYSSLLEWRQQ